MKGIFNILFWFFDLANQYDKKKRAYLRYGYAKKIFSCLFYFAMTLFGLFLLYLASNMLFNSSSKEAGQIFFNIFGGIIVIIIAISFMLAMYKEWFLQSLVAFRCAANHAKTADTIVVEPEMVVIDNEEQSKMQTKDYAKQQEKILTSKTARWFDILIGVISTTVIICMSIGIVLAIIKGVS